MTGIIGFYFLTQGVPASLLLISTATTSLSKTLGHSWVPLLSHKNVNGTETEKKLCPETAIFAGNDKTDAKSRCSVASQLPCAIFGHQTPAPYAETTVGRNGRAKLSLCSALGTGPWQQPGKTRVCLKCLICTDYRSCWRQVILLYSHTAEYPQLQEALGEHRECMLCAQSIFLSLLSNHRVLERSTRSNESWQVSYRCLLPFFFLIISLFFPPRYFVILLISGLSFQVILNQTQGFL